MPPIHKNHLEWLRSWYADLIDTRNVDDQAVRCVMYLLAHMIGPHPDLEIDITGFTIRQKGTRCTLVLKAVVKGIPSVAFVTEQVPTHCVKVVVRKWLNDTIEWNRDRYA